MGGHNLRFPSLRWAGMDGEQIFAQDTQDEREKRDVKFEVQNTSNHCLSRPFHQFRSAILPVLSTSCASSTDLTPRRGLVYDAVSAHIFPYTQRRRNTTWQVTH